MYEKIVLKYKKSVIILLTIGILVTAESLIDKIRLAYKSYNTGFHQSFQKLENNKK